MERTAPGGSEGQNASRSGAVICRPEAGSNQLLYRSSRSKLGRSTTTQLTSIEVNVSTLGGVPT